jgi:ABC-type iron transport system FetAB permease component
MLRGDILAFSIVLISSLVWDYVILVEKSEETTLEKSIFYGLPLTIIPFIVATYVLCLISSEYKTIQLELIVFFEFGILALTAIYAILTKLVSCNKST